MPASCAASIRPTCALRSSSALRATSSWSRAGAEREHPRPIDEAAGWLAVAHIGAALGATRMVEGATAGDVRLLRLAHQHPDKIPHLEPCHALHGGMFEHPVTFYVSRDPVGVLGRPDLVSINWRNLAVGLAREYPDLAVWVQPTELSTSAAASLLMTRPHQADPGLGFERVEASGPSPASGWQFEGRLHSLAGHGARNRL